MSVRFIIGRSGFGKTHYCLQEIRTQLQNEPQGSPLIYLVPDQMTFQSEHALVMTGDISGMVRAQVFSFSRLAWKVLQETGGLARTHLTSVGTNMMLRKIIEQEKPKLRAFGRAADKSGFIDKTADMVTEFKRYCVKPDVFLQTADGFERNKVLQDKLHDLQLIYEKFEQALASHYVDSEDYLRMLAEKIPYSTYLRNAHIWVDGFQSFTPNEYLVLEALMRHANRVTFTLTIDKLDGERSELDLFHEGKDTYRKLVMFARELNVEVEEPLLLTTSQRFCHPSLVHLEAEYAKRPADQFHTKTALHLAAAVHRRAEVEAVAREILSLVRDQGFRFSELGVMVRHLANYGQLIETIFTDYKIPFFLDEKRPMLHHPLIELVRSSLEVILGNWRYEAVFRAVKTDFFAPLKAFEQNMNDFREEMDKLENTVIKLGIQGGRWLEDEVWLQKIYRQLEDENTDGEMGDKRLLELRSFITEPLSCLESELKEAKTVRDMAGALFHFLISLQVPEKITFWLKKAEEAGELATAREHEQAWKAIISFLDEMVEMTAEEEMSLDLFVKLVEAGLDSMKFALVPPAIDQVLIGSLDRSRFTNIKCGFLVGANEGVLPAKPNEDSMLTEQERELLASAGVLLAPGSRRQLLDEEFYIYQALTTASDQLWVSYPLADAEGKSLFPSPVIHRLQELFPDLEEKLLFAEPHDESDQLRFVAGPGKALSYLAGQIRNWQRGYSLDPLWWDVYNWFVHNGHGRDGRLLLNSLFFKNETKPLTKETSVSLYGETIQVSVSRMERFSACAFQQFASHGLRLKEREVFRLDAPDIGELFHASLSRIAEELREQKIEWGNLNKNQCQELADRYVNLLAPRLQSQILLSSNRHHYLTRKLKQVVERATMILSQQAKRSGFSPVGLEVQFGNHSPIPPMIFQLDNGTKLEVMGRIDRVDSAVSDKGLWLRVIDYKSSTRDLSLAEVYFGIAMQMLTYLDVVITHAPKWLGRDAIPAGVLYFHVHNPMLQTKNVPQDMEIDGALFKQFKMKGLVLEDPEAVSLMDVNAFDKDSDMIPVAFKKDGSFKKYSKVASVQQFDAIRSYTRHLIQSIGTKMTDGIIDISPYKLKDKTPCAFCSFRSVCQFDQSLPENNYRLLKAEKDDVMLGKMMKERGGGDE